MRAYRIAGLPAPELPAVGSFPQWQRHIRDLVFWLFEYDLSDQFEKNKEDDPERQNDAALLVALYAKYEAGSFKAAHVEAEYKGDKQTENGETLHERIAIHDAVETIWGTKDFS